MPDDLKPEETTPPEPPKPEPEPKPKEPLKPVEEVIEKHETLPAWFVPYASKLDAMHIKLTKPAEEIKPEPKAEEKPEIEPKKEEEHAPKEKKRTGRIKLWRTL